MPAAVLVRGGGKLFLVDVDSRQVQPLGPDPARSPGDPAEPDPLRSALSRTALVGSVRATDPWLLERLQRAQVPAQIASLAEFRIGREAIPWPLFRAERAAVLSMAQERFAELLASPEETLIALAREEERLERVRSREHGAAGHWITPEVGPMAEYASDWDRFRGELDRHHDSLLARLEREAERTVPNLAAIVGPRVAARLVAAAGGLGALGRMSASRLQLLGARRRAGGNRGPKYGVLARSVYAPEVPPGARGGYARSLAALAAIAARADASTRASVAPALLARRDRRLRTLQRRYAT
ncbi:MAG: hypothetical protein L3J95_03340 [Thermoplasmata archaeon]|nr:hypothetical protein [Thermoplasmata archaeon]MCI4359441.1 hypothetical protein [Thermoplasmata archaeon]